MSACKYKVVCGESRIEYESSFEHNTEQRLERLAGEVTEMEVRRLNRDLESKENHNDR